MTRALFLYKKRPRGFPTHPLLDPSIGINFCFLYRLGRSSLFQLSHDGGFIPGSYVAEDLFSPFIEED